MAQRQEGTQPEEQRADEKHYARHQVLGFGEGADTQPVPSEANQEHKKDPRRYHVIRANQGDKPADKEEDKATKNE